MFRMQLGAGLTLIDGLLSIGLSNNGEMISYFGLVQGILSLGLGVLLAYQSVKRVSNQ